MHLGALIDPKEDNRTVAVKRLHPQFCKDPEFVAMFIDEARLAARIRHQNVVETIDILTMGQELLLVMEYIRGECFSKLLRAARRKNMEPSLGVVARVTSGMLHGLHAAHEARDDSGRLLEVVHRDVSPQNVMVGVDGVAKVLDFGVAKASARIQITRDGQMKGKLSYMSPEQLQGLPVDRRADVFAAGVVLWEALTRRRLFVGEDASDVLRKILKEEVPPPSQYCGDLPAELDAVVLRALSKDPDQRYQTAEEAALGIERAVQLASHAEVGRWIHSVAGDILYKRDRLLGDIERIDPGEVATAVVGGGSITESETFDRIQSWAERESARAVQNDEFFAGEDELEVELEEEETFLDAAAQPETVASGPRALGGQRAGAAFAEPAGLAPSSEPRSGLTASEDNLLQMSDWQSGVGAGLVPEVDADVLRPRRGRRLLAALAAVATLLALGAVVVVGMDQSAIVQKSGALLPQEVPSRVGSLQPEASSHDGRLPTAPGGPAKPRAAQPRAVTGSRNQAVRSAPALPSARGAGSAAATTSTPASAAMSLKRPQSLDESFHRKPKRAATTVKILPSPKPVAASPRRREACDTPYYYDQAGVKRLKMECL